METGKLAAKSDGRAHQLELSLAYAENIIATLREPFVVLDKTLQVRTANSAFYREFQASKEETEGRFVYDLGNGQWNIPRLRTLLEEVLSGTRHVEDFEVDHAFPDLGRRNMLLNARRFPPDAKEPELVLLAIEDVTERRRAHAAMEHSEIRYRRLFQMAKDGILILDADSGKVIDANPFMTALLGYSHDEFLNKELWEIGLFKDIEENRAAYRELREKGYLRYEHLPLETRSGQKVEVEFVSNVYQETHERVVQCNVRDITERSRLQRLTQEQAAALADLDRRKDEFLAMLSHELRNPLAPILNAALLLRLHSNRNRLQGIENPILQQSATIIERQVGQLTHIVDELLEVSRITTGRIQLQQSPVALGAVIENAIGTVRSLIDQRKHELTVSLPTQVIWVNADAARFEQVVVNLLTNAAKYTGESGHIWLTAAQEGEQAVVRVRDTGVGIAPDVLPRIFDLFTQAERSLDRSQGGLGIGLALVQRLVEMHGGTVTVSSVLGQGSEFVVRLPSVSAPKRQPTSLPTGNGHRTSPSLRVLVVDDNVDTVTTLSLLVTESGHDVRAAYDGRSVLETALDYRPNVVLLDIGLPGLNGFDVAKQLRQQPALQNTVLVAMTGYGAVSDLQRSFDAGFDHHLVKPGDFGKVLEILATAAELPAA
jgi:PAS domain S-box-containing protein